MSLDLRPYQTAAIAAVEQAYADGQQRPALVLATGLGKTVTFGHMAATVARNGGVAGVIAHRDELVSQAAKKIAQIEPGIGIGIVKGNQNEFGQVMVMSAQTLARGRVLPHFDFLVVDECHHYVADSYKRVLEDLGAFMAGGPRTLGVTATLARGDAKGLGDVWQSVAYEMDTLEGIRGGYLVDARGLRVTLPALDLAQVSHRQGDYAEGDLGRAMLEAGAPDEIAKVYREHAADRKGLVFTPSVDTAHAVADSLNAIGIPAASIWGAMPLEERRLTLKRAFAGEIQVLVNCMVLTEGFDWPEASCVVVARPTSSAPLYIQIVGRVLRTFPGKVDALVIDVVGVGGRHKLATLADLSGTEEVREGESLAEAVAREETEPVRKEIALKVLRGAGSAHEFDLFGASKWLWKRTRAGNWFLSDGGNYYALAPGTEPGLYNVAEIPAATKENDYRPTGGRWLHEDLEMTLAMAYAEQDATTATGARALNARKAQWRKDEPNAGQVSLARMLRIVVTPEMTKGQLSELIDIEQATRRLDVLNAFKVQA